MDTDYICREVALAAWTYKLSNARVPNGPTAAWAMTPTLLPLFQALSTGDVPVTPFNVWAQFDGLHQEYTLAVTDDVARAPTGFVIRQHLGSAKAKEPGLMLNLIHAPCRVPQLLNRLLIPIFRYDRDCVIIYRDPEPPLSIAFPGLAAMNTNYRHWIRVDNPTKERYAKVSE